MKLKGKLNAEVRRQVISVRSDYQAALKTEKLLQQEFDDARAKVAGMENGLVKFHMLKRDLQTNQALYEGLLGRMKDAAVAATMVPSNIAVINASEPPYKPYMPKPALFLALALVLGAMIGIGTAFFLELPGQLHKDGRRTGKNLQYSQSRHDPHGRKRSASQRSRSKRSPISSRSRRSARLYRISCLPSCSPSPRRLRR